MVEQKRIAAILRDWIANAKPGGALYGCKLYDERHLHRQGLRRYCFVDIYILTPNGRIIAIEIDEHAHRRYASVDERIREVFIAMMVRCREKKPLTIYRINPHTYKMMGQRGTYSRANVDTKMTALKDDLEGLVSGATWDVRKTPWQVLFRYYDDAGARTTNYRLALENLVRDNIAEFDETGYRQVLMEMGIDYAFFKTPAQMKV